MKEGRMSTSVRARTGPDLYPKSQTDFQGWCTDFEGFILEHGPIASNKFDQTMKEMEQ